MRLVTVPEMLEIERAANAAGLSYEQMMENAGRGLAQLTQAAHSQNSDKSILGLVGKGNNGGDTLIALSILASKGWETSAYIVDGRDEQDTLVKRYQEAGGQIILENEDKRFKKLSKLIIQHDVIYDGLLGTGIALPIKKPMSDLLRAVQKTINKMKHPPFIIAVDCPSGVDCNSGETAAESLRADLTLCMAAVKVGLFNFPAFDLVGKIQVVDIGLPAKLKPWKAIKRYVLDSQGVKQELPIRSNESHKGTFGTAMIVAGSINYTGAALLAGKAAYRVGSGLVTLAIPTPLYSTLAGHFPEATWLLLPDELGVIAADANRVLRAKLNRVTCLLIGPGLGSEGTTRDFLAKLLMDRSASKNPMGMGFVDVDKKEQGAIEAELPPLVIDADGLNLLTRIDNWTNLLPEETILTPHPGEMARLTGLRRDEIQADRLNVAELFAKKWKVIIVLKGACTVIASPDGRTAVVPVATPALARAGSGDVLAGMIAGLRAQGLEPFPAASTGAWLHAQAGLGVASRLGTTTSVIAGDLIDEIPNVLAGIDR